MRSRHSRWPTRERMDMDDVTLRTGRRNRTELQASRPGYTVHATLLRTLSGRTLRHRPPLSKNTSSSPYSHASGGSPSGTHSRSSPPYR